MSFIKESELGGRVYIKEGNIFVLDFSNTHQECDDYLAFFFRGAALP